MTKFNALAIKNGKVKYRYTDIVNENGRKKYTAEEENARLRKIVKILADLVAINHPTVLYTPEYQELVEYFNDFELIKANAKRELGITNE